MSFLQERLRFPGGPQLALWWVKRTSFQSASVEWVSSGNQALPGIDENTEATKTSSVAHSPTEQTSLESWTVENEQEL